MRIVRRFVQFGVFALFVFLFLATEYKDSDVLPYAVNVFLRMDPLVGGAAMLAGRAVIALVWPALVLALLTLLLGRVFCGWVCPLGAVFDFTGWVLGNRRRRAAVPPPLRKAKYYLLAALAGSALFTLQLVFLFDPLSILIRSLAVAVYPAVNFALNGLFGALYDTGAGPVTAVSEPVYAWLRAHFLAFQQPFFRAAEVTGLLFLLIVGLEYFQKRFWCRNLCPLGALLGLLGRWGLVRRRVSEGACTGCGACEKRCEMGAIPATFLETDRADCTACLECRDVCPEKAIRFSGGEPSRLAGPDLPRRRLLGALALGAALAPLAKVNAQARTGDGRRIRPPGALPEPEFLARCTRCGECMRVCIANGLQPAVAEAGLEGVWSPVLVPRIGYCEYNCTLCGQVCPTGAIRRLPLPGKHETRIGLAEVDRNRCIPWRGESDCIVCEEHCPTPVKAIRLRREPAGSVKGDEPRTFLKPYVDESLCIGCGICETKCPLSDRAAIAVTSRGESRAGAPIF